MAVGFPAKVSYVNGDVFSASDVNDANGTLNLINPTAKGSIVSASAANTPSRLAVGTDGLILEAASGETTGLKWGFKGIVQVVYARYSTIVSNSTTTYADTNLTATITPKSVNNKVFVMVTQPASKGPGNVANGTYLRLLRGATQLEEFANYYAYTNSLIDNVGSASFNYLDSPATTSATTYKTQFKNNVAASFARVNDGVASITLIEVSV